MVTAGEREKRQGEAGWMEGESSKAIRTDEQACERRDGRTDEWR